MSVLDTSEGDRHDAFAFAFASLIIAALLAAAMGLRFELSGFGTIALLVAFPLVCGMFLRLPGRLAPLSDVSSMLGLMLLMVFSCGTIAILSTRSVAPLADGWLGQADGLFGLSAPAYIAAASHAPAPLIDLLRQAYQSTGQWLVATLVVLPLIGHGDKAWRLLMLWSFTFLTVSLIAFAAPAYGSFIAVDPETMARLPGKAGTFAFGAFENFRFNDDPLLSIDALAGVVTFPSFHTICALLLVQAWSSFRVMGLGAAVLASATIVSTLPIGGHYFIDLPAGALVWWGCTLAAKWRSKTIVRAPAVVSHPLATA